MNNKMTYERLKPIIAMIPKDIVCTSITNNADGSYTMLCKNTKWLTELRDVVILGVTFHIKALVCNESITVTGTSAPGALTFNAYDFYFMHGTVKRVANELGFKLNENERMPLIWLRELVDETDHYEQTDALDLEANCKIYFICPSDFKNWIQEDGDVKVIGPLRNLKNEFIKVLSNNPYVAELTGVGRVKNYNVFGNQSDTGAIRNILNEDLAAVELGITIPFFKECDCCDTVTFDNRPAPAYVLDGPPPTGSIIAVLYSNDIYIDLPSPTCLPVTIKDQYGAIITTVPSGGNYNVTVLEDIQDTITNNTSTIIDNL